MEVNLKEKRKKSFAKWRKKNPNYKAPSKLDGRHKAYMKKYRKKTIIHRREIVRKDRKNLGDNYIKHLICKPGSGLNYSDVTEELIEAVRARILFNRELKKIKEAAHEFFGNKFTYDSRSNNTWRKCSEWKSVC